MYTIATKKLNISSLLQQGRVLPKTWVGAAGLLHRHKKELEKHAKDVRRDWIKK